MGKKLKSTSFFLKWIALFVIGVAGVSVECRTVSEKGTDKAAEALDRLQTLRESGALDKAISPIEEALLRLEQRNVNPSKPETSLTVKSEGSATGRVGVSPAEGQNKQRDRLRMALALVYRDLARYDDAQEQLSKAIDENNRLKDYALFYRGLIYKQKNLINEASQDFERVLNSSAPKRLKNLARFYVGEIRLEQKKWKEARDQYEFLRRHDRESEKTPDILFNLMTAEFHRGRTWPACLRARTLFSTYPTFAKIRSWGQRLDLVEIEGKKLRCQARASDLKKRIRHLRLAGETDQVFSELDTPSTKNQGESDYTSDSVLINAYSSQGRVADAMALLLKYYPQQRMRPPFLNLFAKVAIQAGDYQAAIGAYERAFALAPQSRKSLSSLFQAAFTSYQVQDYDGAIGRFEKLIKKSPGSKLSRDSKWYIAWIQYLRGDYERAIQSLSQLAGISKVGNRRGSRKRQESQSSRDRYHYWLAMSYLKLQREAEAIKEFQGLVRDPTIGYYAVLSYYQLKSLGKELVPKEIATRMGFMRTNVRVNHELSEEEIAVAREAVSEEEGEYSDRQAADAVDVASGDSNDENADDADSTEPTVDPVSISQGENEDSKSEEDSDVVGDLSETEGAASSDLSADEMDGHSNVNFTSPELMLRFARAKDLAKIGMISEANLELSELELRVRKPSEQRFLMSEYVLINNYYRSSYMGEVNFSADRVKGGLQGESRRLWEFAYPRAWESVVDEVSKEGAIPPELIWGIMRAESHFRETAKSPVGAMGLMQLMPFTARQVANILQMDEFAVPSIMIPKTNIRLGGRYLQRLYNKFLGRLPLVAAGYNAGPHRVQAWLKNFGSLSMDEFVEHIPYVETRNYVKKVSRNFQIYNLLYRQDPPEMGWMIQPVGIKFDAPVPSREIW